MFKQNLYSGHVWAWRKKQTDKKNRSLLSTEKADKNIFLFDSIAKTDDGEMLGDFPWFHLGCACVCGTTFAQTCDAKQRKITHEGIRFSLMLARSDLMRRSRSCDNETNTHGNFFFFEKHSCGDIEAEESQLWKISRHKTEKNFSFSSVFVDSHLATSPRENYMLNSRLVFLHILSLSLPIESETLKREEKEIQRHFHFPPSPSWR